MNDKNTGKVSISELFTEHGYPMADSIDFLSSVAKYEVIVLIKKIAVEKKITVGDVMNNISDYSYILERINYLQLR